jgi:valyl-tRNA synthetase
MMPFITEEIWQSFPHEGQSIMTQPFPTEKPEWANAEAEQAFSLLQSFINTARTTRALLNISSSQTPFVYGTSTHDEDTATLTSLKPYIESILRSSVITDNLIPPLRTLRLPSGHFSTIGIPVPNEIDLQEVVKKIQKQIGEKEKEVQRLESRLSSPDFKEKAEPSVIQESEGRRTKLADELDILNITEQQLTSMTA